MALRRPVSVLMQDENSEFCRGKSAADAKDFTERKTLSNITNKLKPTTTPQGENRIQKKPNQSGNGFSRTPLADISNGPKKMLKLQKQKDHSKISKSSAQDKIEKKEEVTEQKGYTFAQEDDIERIHFSGKDMDIHLKKISEEKINKNVKMALSYKSEIPFSLPSACGKDRLVIKECLDLDNVDLTEWSSHQGLNASPRITAAVDSPKENTCGEIAVQNVRNWKPIVRDIAE